MHYFQNQMVGTRKISRKIIKRPLIDPKIASNNKYTSKKKLVNISSQFIGTIGNKHK